MKTIIKHDAFARGGFHRMMRTNEKCRWCGQHRKRLYSYHWEPDDRLVCRTPPDHRVFCNFDCFSAYYPNTSPINDHRR